METPKNIEEALASVEGVLRFDIAKLRRLVAETREKLIASGGGLYPLPKPKRGEPTKGTPDGWAFGGLASHQAALSHCLEGLDEVDAKLARAEAALMEGDKPLAVHCTLSAQLSYFSSAGLWQAGSAIALWRYTEQWRNTNKGNAGKKRPKVLHESGLSFDAIIESLAKMTDGIGDHLGYEELWQRLFDKLEQCGAEPERHHNGGGAKRSILYQTLKRETSLKFGTFKKIISEERKKSGFSVATCRLTGLIAPSQPTGRNGN